jgi:hypothetical protein
MVMTVGSIAVGPGSLKRASLLVIASGMTAWRSLTFGVLFLAMAGATQTSAAGEAPSPQYLLFQVFLGGPSDGVFQRGLSRDDMLRIVQRIRDAVRPARDDPNRILGFSIGPIAMDQGASDARSAIKDAFDAALRTNMAVALHLDDYMFWARARFPDGRLLRDLPDTVEWQDWSGTPATPLDIGWLPHANLAPQLCYESPAVKKFTDYWARDVIGQEIKTQFDRLIESGKPQLFAGVIAGWESNIAYGYCSLAHLGFSAEHPPTSFIQERDRVLQRHVARWAKGIYDAGIPRRLIFTHLAPLPQRDYDKMVRMLPRPRLLQIPFTTEMRTAFNPYSNPGFSAYPDDRHFADIYHTVSDYGSDTWAMAEGTNVLLGPAGPHRSLLSWERYLAQSFNHGAKLVNIFGGFQGPETGEFGRVTESEAALATYRKFLQGGHLVEGSGP